MNDLYEPYEVEGGYYQVPKAYDPATPTDRRFDVTVVAETSAEGLTINMQFQSIGTVRLDRVTLAADPDKVLPDVARRAVRELVESLIATGPAHVLEALRDAYDRGMG